MDPSEAAGHTVETKPSIGWLTRLGLHRRELRAWAMYDWANSGFITVIIASVFPIYYSKVASAGLPSETATLRFTIATTVGLIMIAVLAPILGAVADFAPVKKRMIAFFLSLAVAAVGLMFFVQKGDWFFALILFVVANFGANGVFVFYDALLPHLARDDEMDRVSTAGYALGYVGGGLLLGVCLAWIMKPEWFGLPHGPGLSEERETLPTRLAFLAVAAWWVIFSIPLFRSVPEPEPKFESDEARDQHPLSAAFTRLGETFREIRRFRQAFLMLLAFLIYNDGIGTIYRMATLYGAAIGIGQNAMIGAILITQIIGVPFSFAFGSLASKIGAKPAIFLALGAYMVITAVGYFMKTAAHFLILAMLVGMVQGGAQALSRSLFASLIPRYKAGEFFGFFAVMEKFAGILGPLLFGVMIAMTGSNRNAILSILSFFLLGGLLLYFVDVREGQRAAREADAATRRDAAGA